MSDFHSRPAWRALSKRFKAIERAHGRWKCADCGYKGDTMESDHILCVKHYGMFKLWRYNLALRCGDGEGTKKCNLKKGTRFYPGMRAFFLLGLFIMIKLLIWAIKIAIILFVGRIVYLDLRAGPFDTTFFYQSYLFYYQFFSDSIALTLSVQ